MKDLIKSEAEKYCNENSLFNRPLIASEYIKPSDKYINCFTAGFNRCLELSKQDNEEAYKAYINERINNDKIAIVPSPREVFLSAVKLKDVRIMELEQKLYRVEVIHNNYVTTSLGMYSKLEQKLALSVEVMKGASERLRKGLDSRDVKISIDEALKKLAE
jgi:hypothetical protein